MYLNTNWFVLQRKYMGSSWMMAFTFPTDIRHWVASPPEILSLSAVNEGAVGDGEGQVQEGISEEATWSQVLEEGQEGLSAGESWGRRVPGAEGAWGGPGWVEANDPRCTWWDDIRSDFVGGYKQLCIYSKGMLGHWIIRISGWTWCDLDFKTLSCGKLTARGQEGKLLLWSRWDTYSKECPLGQWSRREVGRTDKLC